MSAAYVIANVNVTDSEQYKEYQRFSSQAMAESGARIRVRGGAVQSLEGNHPGRVVVLEFDNIEAAQAFYDSETYRQARQARDGAAEMTMYIVEGHE